MRCVLLCRFRFPALSCGAVVKQGAAAGPVLMAAPRGREGVALIRVFGAAAMLRGWDGGGCKMCGCVFDDKLWT